LYLNIVAKPCIAVLMDYCWWSACVCGPGPPHRVGVLCVGVRHPAKELKVNIT